VPECPAWVGTNSIREGSAIMTALDLLGWAGSALLVYSVLQTRILRLRLFNCVASAVLVIFNAAIAVWPMVGLNVALTAINAYYIVRLWRGRHDLRTYEVAEVQPTEGYLRHLLHSFETDIRRFNPGFTPSEADGAEFGYVVLTGADTVGVVLARDAGDGSAQVELDYVLPKYRDFCPGEFVYRRSGVFAARGYRRVIAPPRMLSAEDYLTKVGFRSKGKAMVLELA
jgi:hypothetical protein